MRKIAIIDDESIFREYLRTAIDWASYGFEIGFEAKNGVEALELIDKHRVDIVLADINMPFMDGLELAQNLEKKYPGIPVVLITGHSEFDYARKAVKLGVVDYILKPFDKEELILTLLKIKSSLQKVQEEDILSKNSTEALRERILNNLIVSHEEIKTTDMVIQLKRLGILPLSNFFMVSCIEIDDMESRWDNFEERNLWKFAVSNVLQEVLKVSGNHIVFDGPKGRIISIIEFTDKNNSNDSCYSESYLRLCNLIERILGFTITIGIGNVVHGYSSIKSSYNQASLALQNKFFKGSGKVIEYSKLDYENVNAIFYSSNIHEDLLINLRLGNWESISSNLNSLYANIREKRHTIDYTYAIYTSLVPICLSYVVECGNTIEAIFGKEFSPFEDIKKIQSVEALHLWIVSLFSKVIEHSKSGRVTRTKKMTESAKKYIQSNYADNELSVEDVARSIYISSDYLRQIFKKDTGMTVSNYITTVRMNRARELINTGNTKLSEISSMVGYSDGSYFSKCFKKFFGCSPSEYGNV